jgi:hypothetical protein
MRLEVDRFFFPLEISCRGCWCGTRDVATIISTMDVTDENYLELGVIVKNSRRLITTRTINKFSWVIDVSHR